MGRIITLTGVSASGKTTLARSMIFNAGYKLVTSTTTRNARTSDLPFEYEYISHAVFVDFQTVGAFAWSTVPFGNGYYYGTRNCFIDLAFESEGSHLMLLVPDTVPKLYNYTRQKNQGDIVSFFLCTPSQEILRSRLMARGDSTSDIENRLYDFKKWEREARSQNEIPYHFIDSTNSINEVYQLVMGCLKK